MSRTLPPRRHPGPPAGRPRAPPPGRPRDPPRDPPGWLHAVWFGTSLAAGPLLVARGPGARAVAALTVYAVSVSGLFGISALYHRGTWGPAWSVRLHRGPGYPHTLALNHPDRYRR